MKKEQCFDNIQCDIYHSDHLPTYSKLTEDSNRLDDEEEVIKNVSQCLTVESINPVTTSQL